MSKRPKATVDYIPQILFIGNSGVGKTTLIGKLTGIETDASDGSMPTLRHDFVDRFLKIGVPPYQETLNARLYDLRFDTNQSPPSILRHRDIVVLVWSLIDMESFRNIDANLKTICNTFDSHNPYPPHIVLCAHKCDEKRDDTEFNLCQEQYKNYALVKTSRDGTGIPQLEGVFSKILLERYNERSEKKLKSVSDSIELSERLRVDERPEPNCC